MDLMKAAKKPKNLAEGEMSLSFTEFPNKLQVKVERKMSA